MSAYPEHCSFDVDVAEREVADFARLSGDYNPLHNDIEYARTTEFGRPVAHGALLVGYVSRVLGMHIPGRRSLILSMKIRYPKPLFFPTTIRVEGRLKSFNAERDTGLVDVEIVDKNKLWTVLEAEVAFALHAASAGAAPAEAPAAAPVQASVSGRGVFRQRLLLTGGTGGLGTLLQPKLRERYDVCCLTRKTFVSNGGSDFRTVDLEREGEAERFLETLSPEGFHAILHMSSPPMSRGFVSDDIELVGRHLRQSVVIPLLLARWARRQGSTVKRFILIGSTVGTKHPTPAAGAYSLGKAALEHLPRLLAADLAAIGATVNVVSPSLIPVGMNEGLPERARKSLSGRMPTNRLVEAADVASVIEFLLSETSAQVNGTVIFVDGGASE